MGCFPPETENCRETVNQQNLESVAIIATDSFYFHQSSLYYSSMAKAVPTSGLFGQPVRFYVEAAELPWVVLSGAIVLAYVLSFWLSALDITVLPPLVLILQVLGAVTTAYLVGIRQGSTWSQATLTCVLVGLGAGVVSAILALFRFWYLWLIFNLVVEPVWSGLLSAAIGLITLGFFRLPPILKHFRESNT